MSAVAVVVPAFDAERYVTDALESLRAQTFTDWRCIVVDDGSTDSTAALVRACGDERVRLVSQSNRGVSAARNAGLAEVDAAAVLFLDADDTLHPTALERLHRTLEAHPDAVLAFGTSLRVTPSGEPEPGQRPPERHEYVSGDVLANVVVHDRVFWNGGQVLLRTARVREAGGYDTTLRLSEDWELFCRLAALGPCVFIGPSTNVLFHRVHGASTAPRLSLDFRNHLPAIDAVFTNASLRERFTARRWRRMRRRVEADHRFATGRQHFSQRRFAEARRLMLGGLLRSPTRRRLAVFALSQLSRATGRTLPGVPAFHAPRERTGPHR